MSKVVFRGDLRGLLQIRDMDQAQFAFAAGLSLASVSRAVRGEEVSRRTFDKIILALGAIPPVSQRDILGRAASVAKVAGKTRGTPAGAKS